MTQQEILLLLLLLLLLLMLLLILLLLLLQLREYCKLTKNYEEEKWRNSIAVGPVTSGNQCRNYSLCFVMRNGGKLSKALMTSLTPTGVEDFTQ